MAGSPACRPLAQAACSGETGLEVDYAEIESPRNRPGIDHQDRESMPVHSTAAARLFKTPSNCGRRWLLCARTSGASWRTSIRERSRVTELKDICECLYQERTASLVECAVCLRSAGLVPDHRLCRGRTAHRQVCVLRPRCGLAARRYHWGRNYYDCANA